MRHVRWKMGKISDKEFFEEEYNEKVAQRSATSAAQSLKVNIDLKSEIINDKS